MCHSHSECLSVGGQSDTGDKELNERCCQGGNNMLPVFIKGNMRLLLTA